MLLHYIIFVNAIYQISIVNMYDFYIHIFWIIGLFIMGNGSVEWVRVREWAE